MNIVQHLTQSMKGFVVSVRDFFSVKCPKCAHWLDKNRSEDIWMSGSHCCYRCGHIFEEERP